VSSIGAKNLTYEDYLSLPETKQRYEIIDGVMLMAPGPTPAHQWFMQKIFINLINYVTERDLGVVLVASVDLLVDREPLRTRQPDVLYLSAERTGVKGLSDIMGIQVLESSPDLVVEVLSPGNSRRDIEDKLADYKRIAVRECWLVSPEAETVEILRLSIDAAVTTAIFGVDDTLSSEIFDDFTLPIREIFG